MDEITNGTLIINNSKKFTYDIFQQECDFTEKEWEELIKYYVEVLGDVYSWFEEHYGESEFDLYTLGDIINMLDSIDVKKL